MEYKDYPGINLSEDEATRVVKAVVAEQPASPTTFAGLRRAMQLETLANARFAPIDESTVE